MVVFLDSFGTAVNGQAPAQGWYNGCYYGVAPIGSVVAWLKSYANTPQTLPDGWVECDGSVINDSDSPYNGQAAPLLNDSNMFLRGSDTSGGSAVNETHNHGFLSDGEGGGGGAASTFGPNNEFNHATGNNFDLTNETVSSLPTYYEVVWIFRIK